MTRYIGKQPAFGNFVKLDAISVVNGQAAYTMQSGSSNFTNYDNVNQFIVSLNGVIQAPTDSFTVSGSTITFASALSTGDVINFILVLGDVLSIGTPSDNTVSTVKIQDTAVNADKLATDAVQTAKIQNDAVTIDKLNLISTSSSPSLEAKGTSGQTDGYIQLNCEQNSHGIKLKSPPHSAAQSYTLTFPSTAPATDKFLQTNSSGVLSFADAGGGMWEFISSTNVTSAVAQVDFTTLSTDFIDFCVVVTNVHPVDDDPRMYVRVFRQSGGSQVIYDGAAYHYAEIMRDNSTNTDDNTSADHMRISNQMGNASTESMCSEVVFFNPHSTTFHKLMKAHTVIQGSDTGRTGIDNWAGKFASTDQVTGFRFYMQTGNIESGRFSLYGRKHS